jgi:methionyl-tRNA formyltransferase
MKIVFMGTPDFSVGALEAIIEAGYEVTAVVTQPDRPKGRSRQLQMPPVKECALKHGIPVFQPVRLRVPEAVTQLREYPADIYVVAAFGQILSEEVLSIPKYGCINIHASLLPAYRGSAPIQRVIMDGMKQTGITIMQMDKGIDTGDIIMQEPVEIMDSDTGGSLFDRLSVTGAGMIVKVLREIEAGTAVRTRQDESRASYAGMLQKSEGLIKWERTSAETERLIRALDPWPSAYTYLGGRMLKIWRSCIAEQGMSAGRQAPGTVAGVDEDAIYVTTGDGCLRVTEVQLEGKKRMSVHDFLLGVKISTGEVLGSGTGG